jgi:ABC-2 type transport system ATP-binding protein
MITVQNLIKHFGDKKAVDGVSFTINDGEIFCLIGPNSAGKSTIVKSIIGLLEPTSGEILVNGKSVLKHPEQTKKEIGYIPDEPAIWPSMTGEEFIYFTQALYGMNESGREKHLVELLKPFHLSGLEKEYFENYSRGNKQKFSITAAFSHKPKVLLVDEPIVGLDPIGAETAKKMFSQFAKDGGSLLLVTHTLSVAEEISHRLGFLKNGKLVAVGTISELREQANVGKDASLEEVYQKLA